jgi:hypothetical protein
VVALSKGEDMPGQNNKMNMLAMATALCGSTLGGAFDPFPTDWEPKQDPLLNTPSLDEEYIKIKACVSTMTRTHRDLVVMRVEHTYTPRWENQTKWLYQDILEQDTLPAIMERLLSIGTRELIRFTHRPAKKKGHAGETCVGVLYRELVNEGDMEQLECLRARGKILLEETLVKREQDRKERITKDREAAKQRRKDRRSNKLSKER